MRQLDAPGSHYRVYAWEAWASCLEQMGQEAPEPREPRLRVTLPEELSGDLVVFREVFDDLQMRELYHRSLLTGSSWQDAAIQISPTVERQRWPAQQVWETGSAWRDAAIQILLMVERQRRPAQ